MTAAPIVEEVFDQLRITRRKTAFPNGILYFCTGADGQTFDAFLAADETIRLWRFIAACPMENAGTRIELRKPQDPYPAFVLEINEEGELFFRAEGLRPDGPEGRRRTREFIQAFTETEIKPENVISRSISVS